MLVRPPPSMTRVSGNMFTPCVRLCQRGAGAHLTGVDVCDTNGRLLQGKTRTGGDTMIAVLSNYVRSSLVYVQTPTGEYTFARTFGRESLVPEQPTATVVSKWCRLRAVVVRTHTLVKIQPVVPRKTCCCTTNYVLSSRKTAPGR